MAKTVTRYLIPPGYDFFKSLNMFCICPASSTPYTDSFQCDAVVNSKIAVTAFMNLCKPNNPNQGAGYHCGESYLHADIL